MLIDCQSQNPKALVDIENTSAHSTCDEEKCIQVTTLFPLLEDEELVKGFSMAVRTLAKATGSGPYHRRHSILNRI